MTSGANIGTQGVTWAVLGSEALMVIFDLRWMILLIVALTVVDFWWGSKEAFKRYEETGDIAYKWRFSRAGRRTLNKIVDFLTYLLLGAAIGMAIFEPLDICSHTTSAAVALALGGIFDMSSIVGHICYVHNIDTKGGILKILWRIALSYVKKKNSDLGDAISEGVEED